MTTASTSAPYPRPRSRSRVPRFLPYITKTLSTLTPFIAARLFAYLFTRPGRQKLPPHERDWLLQSYGQPLRLASGVVLPLYEWRSSAPAGGVVDEAPLPTVLLVHGFGGRAGQLGGFAAPLVAAGYRVVAFDAPGHGAASGSRSSLPEMLEVTKEVAARLGPLAGVVAHSNGAAAVVAALTQGMRVKRVALLAPMPDLESYISRLAAQIGFTPRVAVLAQDRVEQHFDLPFSALKAETLAPGLTQPALILHDSADRVVPLAEVEALATAWPGAKLETSVGLGHSRLLRDVGTIASVVAHLDQPTLR